MDRTNYALAICLVIFLGGIFTFLLAGSGPGITGAFTEVDDLMEISASAYNMTITENTTLAQDYIFFSQHGIRFNADNITLDCEGHKLISNSDSDKRAIFLNGKDGITVKNCILINWTHSGIYTDAASDKSIIQNNEFQGNEKSILFAGKDGKLSNNRILSGGGIELDVAAHRILIINNTITVTDSDRHGLFLKSDNNTIKYNTITIDGGKDGIRINSGSSGNKIFYNNVILTNGDETASDMNSAANKSEWDDSSCAGNYWSDYSGNGTYSISNGKGTDNYPLVNQWPDDYDANYNGIADCGECIDLDGDGYNRAGASCGILDCNDSNADIYPGALEACDNLDNDCDGQTDEDLNETQPCGLGICSGGEEIRVCSAGVWGNWGECSTDILAVNESCNLLDDDCDGDTDEGCSCTDGQTMQCGIDVGKCASGNQTCVGGQWEICIGKVEPSTEICDGLDNDCNGETDEGNFTVYNGTDEGACLQSITECVNGSITETQVQILPSEEICGNGIDENCDGVDDSCPSPSQPVGSSSGGGGGGGGGSYNSEETSNMPVEEIEEKSSASTPTGAATITETTQSERTTPVTATAIAETITENKWPLASAVLVGLTFIGLFAYNNPKMFRLKKKVSKRKK